MMRQQSVEKQAPRTKPAAKQVMPQADKGFDIFVDDGR